MVNEDTHVSESVQAPVESTESAAAVEQTPDASTVESRTIGTADAEQGEDSPESESAEDLSDPEDLDGYLQDDEVYLPRKQKYPDYQEGDIDFDNKVINASHIKNDMLTIFGSDTQPPNLKKFFHIRKAKPQKANAIAKIAGFKNANMMAGAIDILQDAQKAEASVEEQQEILEKYFPKWLADANEDLPFSFSPDMDEPTVKQEGKTIPFSSKDLETAINKYVAENSSLKRTDLTKSRKLFKQLQEFSGLSRNGKPLTAYEALEMAVKFTDLRPTKTKKKTVGTGSNVRQKSKPLDQDLSPAAQAYAKRNRRSYIK